MKGLNYGEVPTFLNVLVVGSVGWCEIDDYNVLETSLDFLVLFLTWCLLLLLLLFVLISHLTTS